MRSRVAERLEIQTLKRDGSGINFHFKQLKGYIIWDKIHHLSELPENINNYSLSNPNLN